MLAIYSSTVFSTASGLALAPSASIEVRREDTGALASIFSDEAGTTPKVNPFTADAVTGAFSFYAAGLLRGYQVKSTYNAEVVTLHNQPVGTGGQVDADVVGAQVMLSATKQAARDAVRDAGTLDALALAVQQAVQYLRDFLHIDSVQGHRDLIRAGYMPAFFNQQWGGAPHYFEMVDGSTGVPYKFEAATGYIDHEEMVSFGNVGAAGYGRGNGFKVSKSTTVAAVWVKVNKIANPTDNMRLRLFSDAAGLPSAVLTNGTANTVSGKTITADFPPSQYVRFSFATPPSVTAGTQYHWVIDRSGAADGTNYYQLARRVSSTKYPHGPGNNDTNADAFVTEAGSDYLFLLEVLAADESLQSGGLFSDGKLNFFEGNPLNQSNGRVKNLRDYLGLDLTDFTILVRGAAWTKDKTILDITYGLDHDRIVLRSNVTTGFAQVDVYDSGATKRTVTAATVDLSSGNHDVAIRVRAKGDGVDRIDLWVDGAANGTPVTAASFTFDKLFGLARIGTLWIGGGWAVAPAWTKKSDMSVLPSADGWTYVGVPVEGTAFSVSGGKLYMNKNGFGSTDTGYYKKAANGFVNATGWSVFEKVRVATADNGSGATYTVTAIMDDGTKQYNATKQEYFTLSALAASADYTAQIDNKSQDNVYLHLGKGSDSFTFANGRLLADLTGRMTLASGSSSVTANDLRIGDHNGGAGGNADAVWDYFGYHNASAFLPQFTSGALSELALWNGDRTGVLAALWNSAAPVSVKQLLGLAVNHGPDVATVISLLGISAAVATTNTSDPPSVIISDMEHFTIGSELEVEWQCSFSQSGAGGWTQANPFVDAVLGPSGGSDVGGSGLATSAIAGAYVTLPQKRHWRVGFGLHKCDVRFSVNGGTGTATGRRRTFTTRAWA